MAMKCFIRDLQTVGPIFKEDLVRFDNLRTQKTPTVCSAFTLLLSAWHLHPVISRLNCYGQDEAYHLARALYQYVYYWAGSRASSWATNQKPTFKSNNEVECELLYSSLVSQGLRSEVDKLCGLSTSKPICRLNGAMELADTVDKLMAYVGDSSAPYTQYYVDAFRLDIYAKVRKMNNLYRNWEASIPFRGNDDEYNNFKSMYLGTSWISPKVNELSMYIFNSMDSVYNIDTDKGLQLRYILDLMPVNYHCEGSSEFGSVCWNIGVFDGMVKTLKQTKTVTGNKKKVIVNTAINYKDFLKHTQTERLLELSETSQSNLITVATELRDDIVHSLNQSIQQSAADSTNQITGTVQSGFDTLRKHFQQEASFDKAIAKADIAFIQSEIKKYMESSSRLEDKVSKLVGNILYYALVSTTGDYVESYVKMVAHLYSMYNPFKWLTGGTSLVDIMDSAADLMQAIASLREAARLKGAWQQLQNCTARFGKALNANQAYLKNIGNLVESLSAETPPSDFETQKEKFIKGYNDYSPAVDVEGLTEVNAYWELLIDEACDLIDSTSGAVSGGAKLAMGNDCYDAKGEVQKIMALNEEIFDFQFDMMDSLTECVRASNSYASANTITTGLIQVKEVVAQNRESNVLSELKSLAAYSSMLYRSTVLSAKENYCNVLEYTEGSRPELCETHDWNLANLLSRSPVSYHSTEDFKTVPTKPSSTGDKAFIDLKDLYAGKVVMFQIPNSDWLVNRGWISSNDRNKPIFVQKIEVYLPLSSSSEKHVSLVTHQVHYENMPM